MNAQTRIEQAIPAKLFYCDTIGTTLSVPCCARSVLASGSGYLLLSGELPDSEQLASFKELINQEHRRWTRRRRP